jgi:hypothetical protein
VGFDTKEEALSVFNECMTEYHNQTEGDKTNEENDS